MVHHPSKVQWYNLHVEVLRLRQKSIEEARERKKERISKNDEMKPKEESIHNDEKPNMPYNRKIILASLIIVGLVLLAIAFILEYSKEQKNLALQNEISNCKQLGIDGSIPLTQIDYNKSIDDFCISHCTNKHENQGTYQESISVIKCDCGFQLPINYYDLNSFAYISGAEVSKREDCYRILSEQ